MVIKKVTMTGADDSIRPIELFEIANNYPFVEWGILASRNSQGLNRFPSLNWMNELNTLYKDSEQKINLSLHLCGAYVREILNGDISFINEIGEIWNQFKRVQINTHGIKHKYELKLLRNVIMSNPTKEFIFQYDNKNKEILDAIADLNNICTLFDMSHGAGVLPKNWLEPIEGIRCGYAGGLSPDNIIEQINLISEKVNNQEIWIDMETMVRSNNDQLFDLNKVKVVLNKCQNTGTIKYF